MLNLEKNNQYIIAGPCSIESQEQIYDIAFELNKLGINHLRGGAFKPRTSPKSFQGLGEDGLHYLKNAADKYGMKVVSEVMDSNQLEKYIDLIDIVQVGSKNMMSYEFLKQVGRITAQKKKPVLLKRGFNSTLQEFLFSAEYISEMGNSDILLCLRGIRTFEQIDSKMRFTPDLAGIIELKERLGELKYPVLFDPSHAAGNSKYVIDLSKAAILLGADGLLIETHLSPEDALSDGEQSVLPEELKKILDYIENIKL
jgi:3-deoxy-7-phosphoheptulonate synthase